MDGAFLHSLRLKFIDYICAPDADESVAAAKARMEEFYQVLDVVYARLRPRNLYRVRKIEPDEQHIHLDHVWCPKPEKVLKIGRANDIGQSVFYGALDPATAVAESRISPGEKFSLAEFHLKSSETHASVLIRQAEDMGGQNPELSRYGVELSKFMVHQFTRTVPHGSEHLYRRSCALAQMLWETPRKDSLIYPSVQNQDGVNIAIKSDAATRRLDLKCVITCEMTPEKALLALEYKTPNHNGSLVPYDSVITLPNLIQFTGSRTTFSEKFLNVKISTAEDVFNEIRTRQRDRSDCC